MATNTPTPDVNVKRQRRASKPKVKTGCNNCKSRRVKCDEARPECNRCVRSGRGCDGYPAYNPRRDGNRPGFITPIAPAPLLRSRGPNIASAIAPRYASSSTASSTASSSSSSTSSALAASTNLIRKPVRRQRTPPPSASSSSSARAAILSSPTNVSPSISLGFNTREGLYFRLFREHTANELSGFFDSGFWTESVLQESHSEASIKHAVVALGALYKTLEKAAESPPGSPSKEGVGDTAPDHYNFALQQYGKSLTRLREVLASGETRSPRTVLISIVLFTCFQSFTGDHKNAIRQIQSGLHLLEERRAEDAQPMIPEKKDVLEPELVQMFTRLAVQAKSYDMAFHFPPPYVIKLNPAKTSNSSTDPSSPASSSSSNEPMIPEIFESLHEARTALDSIMERMIRFSEAFSSYFGGPSNILPSSLRSSGSSFRRCLENWCEAFEHLLKGRRNAGVTSTQRAGINVLKMMQLMSEILFWSGFSLSEMIFDNFTEQFRSIVELAKEVVVEEELSLASKSCGSLIGCRHSERLASHRNGFSVHMEEGEAFSHIRPSFALDLGIVPPLFVAATKSRHRKIRREAIRLLMSSPRREGMWDSILCGRVATWIMEIEEQGLPPYQARKFSRAGLEDIDETPDDDRRVMVKEILFNLQDRSATLRCGTRGLMDGEQDDARARETHIRW